MLICLRIDHSLLFTPQNVLLFSVALVLETANMRTTLIELVTHVLDFITVTLQTTFAVN